MHTFLFFEFIGTSELLVVLFVALIVFGPRKLPEMGRSLGKALHQFREASDSLKRTWETEALLADGNAAALTHADSAAHVSVEETHSTLVTGDAPRKELTDGEGHAPIIETVSPDGASHVGAEAALGESRT